MKNGLKADRFSIEGSHTIVDYVRGIDMQRDPNAVVIEYEGNKITRREYWDLVSSYSQFLLGYGIDYHDKVAICNMNLPEYEFFYFGMLDNGTVASTVSLSFLESDVLIHTVDKGAETLILSAEYIRKHPKELKEAFSALGENKGEKQLKRIILTSAGSYSGAKEVKYNSELNLDELITALDLPENVEVLHPSTAKRFHEDKTFVTLSNGYFVDMMDEVATYSNTGGTTTGVPKCAVHTHRAMAKFVKTQVDGKHPEYLVSEGTRSLMLIPISHITCQFYAMLTRVASGATRVYDPMAFSPEVITKQIVALDIKDVVMPFTLQVALTHSPLVGKGTLTGFKPQCGGEATPLAPTIEVNRRYVEAGAEPMAIGGGSTEFGSVTMSTLGLDNRTNETGMLYPGVTAEIINPMTGKKVSEGEHGILYVASPWVMRELLNDSVATSEFFSHTDENGTVYGTNNDIARVVGRDSDGREIYSISGRAKDFVLPLGNKKYKVGVNIQNGVVQPVDFKSGNFLFDARDKMLSQGAIEAEAVLVPSNGDAKDTGTLVGFVRGMNPEDSRPLLERVDGVFKGEEFSPLGIAPLTHFAKSPATDKRDVKALAEYIGPYYSSDDGVLSGKKLLADGTLDVEVVDSDAPIAPVAPPKPGKIMMRK